MESWKLHLLAFLSLTLLASELRAYQYVDILYFPANSTYPAGHIAALFYESDRYWGPDQAMERTRDGISRAFELPIEGVNTGNQLKGTRGYISFGLKDASDKSRYFFNKQSLIFDLEGIGDKKLKIYQLPVLESAVEVSYKVDKYKLLKNNCAQAGASVCSQLFDHFNWKGFTPSGFVHTLKQQFNMDKASLDVKLKDFWCN